MLLVDIRRAGETVTLMSIGRIVVGQEAEALEQIATTQRSTVLVIDLAGVETIDAAGLGTLVRIKMWSEGLQDEFRKGAATYWGFDEQYVPTQPPSMRYLVSMYPDADGLDKWSVRQTALLGKMSPEERKAFQETQTDTTVPNGRRDLLARITRYAQK